MKISFQVIRSKSTSLRGILWYFGKTKSAPVNADNQHYSANPWKCTVVRWGSTTRLTPLFIISLTLIACCSNTLAVIGQCHHRDMGTTQTNTRNSKNYYITQGQYLIPQLGTFLRVNMEACFTWRPYVKWRPAKDFLQVVYHCIESHCIH